MRLIQIVSCQSLFAQGFGAKSLYLHVLHARRILLSEPYFRLAFSINEALNLTRFWHYVMVNAEKYFYYKWTPYLRQWNRLMNWNRLFIYYLDSMIFRGDKMRLPYKTQTRYTLQLMWIWCQAEKAFALLCFWSVGALTIRDCKCNTKGGVMVVQIYAVTWTHSNEIVVAMYRNVVKVIVIANKGMK